VITQRLILMYVILRQKNSFTEIQVLAPTPFASCFSKCMLISEMLQTHENLNIGDFNIKLSFDMKFITASLDPYTMHEQGHNHWGSGGPDPPNFAWTPPTFWTNFFLGVQSRWGPLFMIDNQFTYSYLTT
jgi:hypothetical protein